MSLRVFRHHPIQWLESFVFKHWDPYLTFLLRSFPWHHLLVHFTSFPFLGDVGIFLLGSRGLLLAHTILISRTCPATLSPSIYIYISYCRISKVKYNVRDTLPCWYCLLGFINLSSRISMVIGELTGIVNSLVWAARKRNSPIRWT